MRQWAKFWHAGWLLLPWLALAGSALTLPDIGGNPHALSEFIGHGRWTIVALWSVDCAICQREIPQIAFFHDEHRRKNAAVLGVAIDGVAERTRIKKFVGDNALGFPNLIAERGDVAEFGAGPLIGTPTYLFFSPTGKLVTWRVGSTSLTEMEKIIAAR